MDGEGKTDGRYIVMLLLRDREVKHEKSTHIVSELCGIIDMNCSR